MYWVSVWFLKPVFLYYTLFCGGFLLFYQNKVHLFTGSGDVRIQKNFSPKTQTVFKRFRGEVFCFRSEFTKAMGCENLCSWAMAFVWYL